MPTFPSPFDDPYLAAGSFLEQAQEDFFGSPTPSTLGYGTRQSKLPANRQGTEVRQIIHWIVPEGPIIQMYVNPQSITYSYPKDVIETRSKGGYILQYFGPQLPSLSISGTTGSSGQEGINVLNDLYLYEQIALDPYALYNASKSSMQAFAGNIFGEDSALTAGAEFVDSLIGGSQAGIPTANVNPPSLADIAFRIEMYYRGSVYRGYFSNFTVTESVDKLGWFDYSLTFKVTKKSGFSSNFFKWHRSAVDGPSNSDPNFGVPYSYNSLVTNNPPVRNR